MQFSGTAERPFERLVCRRHREVVGDLSASLCLGLRDGLPRLYSSTSKLVHAGTERAILSIVWCERRFRRGGVCRPWRGDGGDAGMGAFAIAVESAARGSEISPRISWRLLWLGFGQADL